MLTERCKHLKVFLCPLGSLTTMRRKILERRICEQGGATCTTAADATHCVRAVGVPDDRLHVPPGCKIVGEAWLMHGLDHGDWAHDFRGKYSEDAPSPAAKKARFSGDSEVLTPKPIERPSSGGYAVTGLGTRQELVENVYPGKAVVFIEDNDEPTDKWAVKVVVLPEKRFLGYVPAKYAQEFRKQMFDSATNSGHVNSRFAYKQDSGCFGFKVKLGSYRP